MILCSEECIPCCDFCIYAKKGSLEIGGTDGPVGCNKHLDSEHQEIAEECGYCDDYHCFLAGGENIE